MRTPRSSCPLPSPARRPVQVTRDLAGFWAEQAQLIDWQTPFSAVLDYSKPPFARWFVGGRTNICHNAIDRHLAARGDQKAAREHVFRRSATGLFLQVLGVPIPLYHHR